jgi:Zn-dependent protease with chaperone function
MNVAIYYDGRTPVGVAASLVLDGDRALVTIDGIAHTWERAGLRVSPRVGRSARYVSLPGGGQLECPDDAMLEQLPQTVRSEGPVAWLEARPWVAAICVMVVAASLVAANIWLVPRVAERVAAHVPMRTEVALGTQMLEWLDRTQRFEPSRVTAERRAEIEREFSSLHGPSAYPYRLEVRRSPVYGPNAFALPGGIVVVTDAMIELATREELLAVLAHEIAHVERHHGVRLLLESSSAAIVAATLTADAASLTAVPMSLPLFLTQTQYSRELEAEADESAFTIVARHGISPTAFGSILAKLPQPGEDFVFLSTHPRTSSRIQAARAAATGPETISAQFGGHHYSLTGTGDWKHAEAEAQKLGGHLCTIDSHEKNDWLIRTFGNSESYWIGLHQLPGSTEPDGGWTWIGGTPLGFTNWASRQPDNYTGADNFGMLLAGAAGAWHDVPLEGWPRTSKFRGIVER